MKAKGLRGPAFCAKIVSHWLRMPPSGAVNCNLGMQTWIKTAAGAVVLSPRAVSFVLTSINQEKNLIIIFLYEEVLLLLFSHLSDQIQTATMAELMFGLNQTKKKKTVENKVRADKAEEWNYKAKG